MSDYRTDEWKGDKPFFLVIREYEEFIDRGGRPARKAHTTVIDLDQGGWSKEYADKMRVPGTWMLCSKDLSAQKGVLVPLLIIQVEEGDQPYFTTKHVGIMSFGDTPGPDTICYGIGKKRWSGEMVRLWVLPNGSICGGDDVYWIADRMNKGQL